MADKGEVQAPVTSASKIAVRVSPSLPVNCYALTPTQVQAECRYLSQVFAKAFAGDPWILKLMPKGQEDHQRFFYFLLRHAVLTGQRVLVATSASDPIGTKGASCDEIVGVAIVAFAKGTPTLATSDAQYGGVFSTFKSLGNVVSLLSWMGFKRFSLLNQYMAITTRQRKGYGPGCSYLVCIGVLPEAQGQGIGKALLEYIHWQAKGGIALDTEAPQNVALYQGLGYALTGTHSLEDITIYTLFKKIDP